MLNKSKPSRKFDFFPTDEELKLFFQCSKGTFYDNAFRLQMLAGLRNNELYALTVQDIDLEERVLTVRRTLTYAGGEYIFGLTKTGPRRIHLSEYGTEIVKKQLASRENINIPDKFKDFLFVTADGEALNSFAYAAAVKEITDSNKELDFFWTHAFKSVLDKENEQEALIKKFDL